MSWGSKQKRLKDLLGTDNNLCFSVFVIVTESNIQNRNYFPKELFDTLQKVHGVELNKGDNFPLPKLRLGEIVNHGGYLFWASNGDKLIEQRTLTPVYTISPYTMPYDNHPEYGDAALDMHFIKSLYFPQILEKFPDHAPFSFDEDDYYIDWDDFSIQMGYVVQPYTSSVCHPRDLGVLKPIEMPKEITITPLCQSLTTQKDLKMSPLRNKSFSLR